MDMFQASSGRHSVHDLGLPAEWVAVAPIIVGHPKNPARLFLGILRKSDGSTESFPTIRSPQQGVAAWRMARAQDLRPLSGQHAGRRRAGRLSFRTMIS